jgi:hypothetical protein
MFLTSLPLLVAAVVVMVVCAFRGSTLMLTVSLGMAVGGAGCLGAALLIARRTLARQGLITATHVGAATSPPAPPVSVLSAPPLFGYDDMEVSQVVALVSSGALGREQLALLLAYEAANQARPEILEVTQRALTSAVPVTR